MILASHFYIKVFWDNRQLSIGDACKKMSSVIEFLDDKSSDYKNIFFVTNEKENDLKISLDEFELEELEKLITSTFINTRKEEILKYNEGIVIDENFMQNTGFHFWFYTSQDPRINNSIRSVVGKYNEGLEYYNYVLLEFSREKKTSLNWFIGILKFLVQEFEPDYGGVFPYFTKRLKGKPKYFPGWVSYCSKSFPTPEIPKFVEVENLSTGFLYYLIKEDFDYQSQEHLEKWKTFYLNFLEELPPAPVKY